MKPYYQDNHITQYCMDFRENDLPDNSVQMCVTSPPYWGLRKYSGEQDLIWGGDKDCVHEWGEQSHSDKRNRHSESKGEFARQGRVPTTLHPSTGAFCQVCGAWRGAFGLEPTPEMYAQHTIEILREIRRVLRKDGVVFWNIGDSYNSKELSNGRTFRRDRAEVMPGISRGKRIPRGSGRWGGGNNYAASLKPKDLCLIPFRVAIAAQEDGWWVRSDIIWSKPNPMPESVTDRPTNSHEHILMLTKSAKYYWDADAVREDRNGNTHSRGTLRNPPSDFNRGSHKDWVKYMSADDELTGRNLRSVWTFPTQPYPEAHFAVFPEKLPETCIKAATPEVGCCSKCGSPWERITDRENMVIRKTDWGEKAGNRTATSGTMLSPARAETLGWQPTCKCNAGKVPSIVLDPFAGAGTTLWVAKKLGRKAIGFDTSEQYCELNRKRNEQQALL